MIILLDIETNKPLILTTKKQLIDILNVNKNTVYSWSKASNYKLFDKYVIYFNVETIQAARTRNDANNDNLINVVGSVVEISEYIKLRPGKYKHIKTGKIENIAFKGGKFRIQ